MENEDVNKMLLGLDVFKDFLDNLEPFVKQAMSYGYNEEQARDLIVGTFRKQSKEKDV